MENLPKSLGSQKPYEYSQLNTAVQEIRLLHLLPGGGSSNIDIVLETLPIASATERGFEALSYLWGSTNDAAYAIVRPSGAIIPMTRNLHDALWHLRRSDTVRVVWADAICINQTDLEERGQQVRFMASIFSQATGVIAWLGLQSRASDVTFAFVERIGKLLVYDWATSACQWRSTSEIVAGDRVRDVLRLDDEDKIALLKFFCSPYFRRVWIYQELRLSQDRLALVCGYSSITWESFSNALACLSTQDDYALHPIPESLNAIFWQKASKILWSLVRPGKWQFMQALDTARILECKDDRDRVFAVLSTDALMNRVQGTDDQNIRLVPDYTAPLSNVFKDVTLQNIRQRHSLDILTYIAPSKLLTLPSWVPDWTASQLTEMRFVGVEACPAPADVPFKHEGNILQIKGKIITQIAAVAAYDISKQSPTLHEVVQALWRMLLPSMLQRIGNNDQALIESLCTVLIGDQISDRFVDLGSSSAFETGSVWPNVWPSQRLAVESLPKFLLAGLSNIRADERHLLVRINQYCRGRALVSGQDGHIGLGPEACRPGDVVAILYGCYTPLVLRPTGHNRSCLSVIGPVYYQSIMRGEPLLGPLPSAFEDVIVLDSGAATAYRAYQDRASGAIQVEDPRLKRDLIVRYKGHIPIYETEGLLESLIMELDWLSLV